jgi:hypothetical protein
MSELRADFVKGAIYADERTKNRDRKPISGAPTSYLRGWAIGFGPKPKAFALTDVMLHDAFLIAERNPEDMGVWVPPPVAGPRYVEPPIDWRLPLTLAVGIALGLAVGILL